MRVVLLTNDRGNLKRARDEGIDAVSCREFAKRAAAADSENAKDAKGLADLVAPSALDEEEDDGTENGGSRAALKRARGDDADDADDAADGDGEKTVFEASRAG